jgi:glutathione S-transferase
MILYGRYLSPYTRRVGVALHVYGMAYTHRASLPWKNLGDVLRLNPVGRVPILELDDGTRLIESAAILDTLDRMAGPEKSLTPLDDDAARRVVIQLTALGLGAIDKAIEVETEILQRPQPQRSGKLLGRFVSQAGAALSALEAALRGTWFHGNRMTQADATAVVGYQFMQRMVPDLVPEGRYPRLAALVERCAPMAPFASTPMETDAQAVEIPALLD